MDIKMAFPFPQLTLCLFIGLLTACQPASIETRATTPYQSVSYQPLKLASSYPYTHVYSGQIRAINTTDIGFELAGKITMLQADTGDFVHQGQVLAKLDTQLLAAEQNQLNASLAQNQANIAVANATLKRNVQLQQQGYASAQQLDELQGTLNVLLAAKKQLIASLHANQLKIDKSTLRAPFNGKVSQRHHHLAEVISIGSPVFTFIEPHHAQAYIGVPVAISHTLSLGQTVNLQVRERPYVGTVAGIGAELDPVTRTVQLRITLPTTLNAVNGEMAYLHYQDDIATEGYWVPISALTDGMRGLWNLYVIVQDDQHRDIVERRDVEIIDTTNERAFVQGAISPGELYIDQGLHKLVTGQVVKRHIHAVEE